MGRTQIRISDNWAQILIAVASTLVDALDFSLTSLLLLCNRILILLFLWKTFKILFKSLYRSQSITTQKSNAMAVPMLWWLVWGHEVSNFTTLSLILAARLLCNPYVRKVLIEFGWQVWALCGKILWSWKRAISWEQDLEWGFWFGSGQSLTEAFCPRLG